MKGIPQKTQNQINHSITTSSSNMPLEHLESLHKKVSILSKWGFGERLVPHFMANDPASQKITKIHLQHYEITARYVPQRSVLDIACGTVRRCCFIRDNRTPPLSHQIPRSPP